MANDLENQDAAPAEQEAERHPIHIKRLGRELAMQYLFQCDIRQELPDAAGFDAFFAQSAPEFGLTDNHHGRKAREYAAELYELVTLHKVEIDDAIKARSEHWDFDRMSIVERNIMRIAVAEMKFADDVPPVVSIDEAVEIARDYSGPQAGSFLNGVLNGVKDALAGVAAKPKKAPAKRRTVKAASRAAKETVSK